MFRESLDVQPGAESNHRGAEFQARRRPIPPRATK